MPAVAFEEAPMTTGVLAPAAMLNGLSGLDVTPVGSPEIVTWTEPVKPFSAFTETLRAELLEP